MGLFARLFKIQPSTLEDRAVETGAGEKATAPPPDPGVFLQPKDFPPRVPVPVRSAAPLRPASVAKPTPPREITLLLGDLLPRIPAQYLKAGAHDPRHAVRFLTAELSTDIARGRVTVPLSRIAAQCPDVFQAAIKPEDDVEIRLPLQRLLDQLTSPGLAVPAASEAQARSPLERQATSAPPPAALEERPVSEWDTAPAAESGDEKIHLSLAAIVAGCPEEIFVAGRPRVDDTVRLSFPFAPIERQLAGGRVEITAQRLLALLPPEYAPCFQARDGVKVPLPLEEIFQNLPGAPPPAVAPVQAPAPPPPVAVAEAPPPQFHFFSPAPPILHPVAPPAEPKSEPAAERPAGAPPLRSIEVRASPDAALSTPPAPKVLLSAKPPPVAAPPPTAPIANLSTPPHVRPLVVLPPPIAGGAVAQEVPLETTADQAAVLDFLSGVITPTRLTPEK